MSETLRDNLRAIAFKIETTAGTDVISTTPGAGDWVGCDFSFSIAQESVENPEENGSLDAAPAITTGLRGTAELRIPLRGSGTAGTAPEWGKLLRACGWVETITAAALGAPTALAAGTGTTGTLGAPFGTTAQQYRGMPLLFTGTPAGAQTIITDYTAGKVATFADTFSPALTVAALAQIPINVLYSPSSDESALKTGTVYIYEDGLRHRLVGCVGSFRLEMMAGKPGFITVQLRGQVLDAHQAVALPAGWNTVVRPVVPVWLNGKSQLNRGIAKTDSFRFDAGVQLADPENPEAVQGYDAPIITGRMSRAELAPFATTTLSPSRFTALQNGASVPFAAIVGSAAGNRVAVSMPSNRITAMDRGKRSELGVDQLQLRPDLPDAGLFLAQF